MTAANIRSIRSPGIDRLARSCEWRLGVVIMSPVPTFSTVARLPQDTRPRLPGAVALRRKIACRSTRLGPPPVRRLASLGKCLVHAVVA